MRWAPGSRSSASRPASTRSGARSPPSWGRRRRDRIGHFLTRKVEKGQLEQAARDEAVGRLTLTTELEDFAGCDLVIEAIVEELEPKRELFAELDRICGPDAVLATNTSALSVTEIAAATTKPERVVGMHFFNPAPLMPLVEIVRAELTADEPFETAYAFGERIGKTPIRCHDTPGFVVNRVLIPLLNDCIRVLDEARVTPEDLDTGMKNGAGWPMGPCALVDLVGIDVHVHASEALYEKTREPRMAPPPRLVAMRNAGLLGRKSGRGFYEYLSCARDRVEARYGLRSLRALTLSLHDHDPRHTRRADTATLMRKTFVLLGLLALALPVAGVAALSAGEGTLSVEDGVGKVTLQARGGVIGRLDRGSVTIYDLTPEDANDPCRLRRRQAVRLRRRDRDSATAASVFASA